MKAKPLIILWCVLVSACSAEFAQKVPHDYSIKEEILDAEQSSEDFTSNVWRGAKTFLAISEDGNPVGMEMAIDVWNEFVPGLFREDGEIVIRFFIASQSEIVEVLKIQGKYKEGILYDGASDLVEAECHIYILNGLERAESLYAHEIGHCAGFKHSSNPDSIMAAQAGNYFTKEMIEFAQQNYWR